MTGRLEDSSDWRRWFAAGTCPECGYSWTISLDAALQVVSSAPGRYAALIGGRDASRTIAPDGWSAGAYLWHVADAVRIWAERFWQVAHHPEAPVVPYDQDRLAAARGYEMLSPVAGAWALERSVGDWETALEALDPATEVRHLEFGSMTVADAIRTIGHELYHHDLDIRRALGT